MSFKLREYQKNIIENCLKYNNNLVILPTGTGKTIIAYELLKNTKGKKLLLAPSKPLVLQHYEFFKNHFENVVCFTGELKKEKRKKYYFKEDTFIIATPQTIENDLKNDPNILEDFSIVVFDEVHRCVGNYAYANIAKKLNPSTKVLGLTASPGYSKEKIKEICENLNIENIEIRTGDEKDIKKYIPKTNLEIIYLELPKELKEISELIDQYIKRNKIPFIKNNTRTLLLQIQSKAIKNNDYDLAVKTSSLLLALHGKYLLETQSVTTFKEFLIDLKRKKTKSSQKILNSLEFRKIEIKINELKIEHPKINKILEIMKDKKKTIIFTNYRDTAKIIEEKLNENKIKAIRFIGQNSKNNKDKGMSQKEQKEIIEKFRNGEFNCLVCTSVGEEGIDIPKVDRVIFYEPIPSEIRTIQRRGRVGRTQSGEIIFLATKKTYDEVNLFISKRKEKKMKEVILKIKEEILKNPIKRNENKKIIEKGNKCKKKENLNKWLEI